MKKYSIKKYRNKGRNIKKYKKSRRGCRKRSLIGGKTRRYKVFKNTKRRTLGKRKGRRMVGGEPWTFRVDANKLGVYVNDKYTQSFSRFKLVAFGDVAITNTSKHPFIRAEHSNEKIVVVACYNGNIETPVCYAIARCTNTCDPKGYTLKDNEPPNFNMRTRILFLNPQSLIIIETKSPTTRKETTEVVNSLEKKLSNLHTNQEYIRRFIDNILMVEFKNMISSQDGYRIVVFPYNLQTLQVFFSQVKNNNFNPIPVTYPLPQPVLPRGDGDGDGDSDDDLGLTSLGVQLANALLQSA